MNMKNMSANETGMSELLGCPWCNERPLAITYPGGLYVEHSPSSECPAKHLTITVEDWNRRAAQPGMVSGDGVKSITDEDLWAIYVKAYSAEHEKHYLGHQEYAEDADAKASLSGARACYDAAPSIARDYEELEKLFRKVTGYTVKDYKEMVDEVRDMPAAPKGAGHE